MCVSLEMLAVALLQLSPHFDAIYVDVGGISGSEGELEGVALVRLLISAYGYKQGGGGRSDSSNDASTLRRLRFIVVKVNTRIRPRKIRQV